MDEGPNRHRHTRSEISDAVLRAWAEVIRRRAAEWLNILTREQLANFAMRVYIQEHLDQGNQGLTGEVLVVRANQWMTNLPADQILRHFVKGFLDQNFNRLSELLHSQTLARARFQASYPVLS